ncbi:lysine N(6)-hydroxylase/L-ornithine N(5)-oxygenase family protein [Streptomyces sp. KR80]|uniref:lysine N(6)-hydroxylase/L-ornithine N(5)-oxygenase family protein n=1 Tax=Streptomyces sp. KR80 TaxID=3457426 RepID=UPI003FD508BF
MDRIQDYVGIGIGPANLSLAALAAAVPELSGQCFDKRQKFQWHPGLLLDGATIQVSPLKDLVTLVDPTSPFSFLSYLSSHGRLYRFLIADFPNVLRAEFNDYYQWVSKQISNLNFGQPVSEVDYLEGHGVFQVTTPTSRVHARNIVLGTGLTPYVPPIFQRHLGAKVIHASDYLTAKPDVAGKRVLIVGGGQTGAEILLDLLARDADRAREVTWVSRRSNFLPMDDSPFTNELFLPPYSDFFFSIPEKKKEPLLAETKLASDGIDLETLQQVYRRLYEIDCLGAPATKARLLPGREATTATRTADGWDVGLRNQISRGPETVSADVIVLSTGYHYESPACLAPIENRLARTDGLFDIDENYAIKWDGPENRKIYLQNGARHARGSADPNLSLLAWRSARIINDLVGYSRYEIDNCDAALSWKQVELRNPSGVAS